MLRYLTSVLTAKYTSNLFPVATVTVNILGCFLIGLLIGSLGSNIQGNQNMRLLFITGFCGGYTTFSAFAAENIALLQNQHYWTAALYIAASVIGGLIAVYVGMSIVK